MSLGRSVFQLGYELSPIILTQGIASAIPGQMLPIIAITQAANFTLSLLNGESPIDPNAFFGRFRALPGGTLIDNEVGDYPFANQSVAANAIIAKPLNVSMLMASPVNQSGGYTSKLITFSALKAALDKHNQSGGTYTVATPAFLYTNCLLTGLRDVSNPSSQQMQNAWQFDFVKPLLTLEQASTATQKLNSLMSSITNGLPNSPAPTWSGLAQSAIGKLGVGL